MDNWFTDERFSHFTHYVSHQLQSNLGPIAFGGLTLLVAYSSYLRRLRFARLRNIEKKYSKRIAEVKKRLGSSTSEASIMHELHLTPKEAQEIVAVSMRYDLPEMFGIGEGLGLFYTYGVPSIARVLAGANSITSKEYGEKRLRDTLILISTALHCPIAGPYGDRSLNVPEKLVKESANTEVDPRGAIAVARINFLHSKYKIDNNDFIFTLAQLLFWPIDWAAMHGWRNLTPLEEEAHFVLWKEFGVRMNIYDIPPSLKELREWTKVYAEEHTVPDKINHKITTVTLDTIVEAVPFNFGIRNLFRMILISYFDEGLLRATMLSKPPLYVFIIRDLLFGVSSFLKGYLTFPSSEPSQDVPIELTDEVLNSKVDPPRLHSSLAGKEPWYEPEYTGFNAAVQNTLARFGLVSKEFMPGPRFRSQGYRLEELGPAKYENSGHKEVMKMAEEIQGCPISGIWAR